MSREVSSSARVLIALGLVLDTDIRRAVGAFCMQLKIGQAQAVSILQSKETEDLIRAYKEGRATTKDFFDSLKGIIRSKEIDTSTLDATDPNWALNCWNAQAEVNEARLAQIAEVAKKAELFIYSDTNPAHMEKIGIDALLARIGADRSKLFLSYELGKLDAYSKAFDACFAVHDAACPVILIVGPTPPLQTAAEAALHRSMLEKASSTEGGKDVAFQLLWDGKSDLAASVEAILHPSSAASFRP